MTDIGFSSPEGFRLKDLTDEQDRAYDETTRSLTEDAELSDAEAARLAAHDIAMASPVKAEPGNHEYDPNFGVLRELDEGIAIVDAVVSAHRQRLAFKSAVGETVGLPNFGAYFASLSGLMERLDFIEDDGARADALLDIAALRAANPDFYKQEFEQ